MQGEITLKAIKNNIEKTTIDFARLQQREMMKNHFVKRKEKESKEIKSRSITHEILCATFNSTLNPNEVEMHINYFVLSSRKLSV